MKRKNILTKIKLVPSKNNTDIEICPYPFNQTHYKRAFTTRNVNDEIMETLITGDIKPKAGDLVLCKVTRLRQHCRIELANGRRARMFVNDEIIVCYGNRYAPDQFEAEVPEDISACHLVAGGGIAAKMLSKNPKIKPATEIMPIGLIANANGKVINVKDYTKLDLQKNNQNNVPIVLVAGSSMNAGKTTTVAKIIKSLRADGYTVGAAKVTGTGSGGDLWHFIDADVNYAIDFTDAGFVSTYKVKVDKLVDVFQAMTLHLRNKNVDIILVEIADGILQQETKMLLNSRIVKQLTTSVVYSAGDSTSSIYGYQWLKKKGYDVIAVSGVVSSIPLARKEIEKNIIPPVLDKNDLSKVGFGHSIMERYKLSNNSITKDKHSD